MKRTKNLTEQAKKEISSIINPLRCTQLAKTVTKKKFNQLTRDNKRKKNSKKQITVRHGRPKKIY